MTDMIVKTSTPRPKAGADGDEGIRTAQSEWERRNADALRSERRPEFVSEDGIVIKRVYTPLDLADKNFDYLRDLGLPGEYPYTRGITPTMYRGQMYHIGQLAGSSSVEETNALFKKLIANGQQSLHMAFDLPTKNGYDSDHPMSAGDVGRAGMAIDSVQDMEILFDGVDLSRYPCTMVVTNSVGITLLAMLLVAAEKQGHDHSEVAGMVQNDVLTGYGAGGQYAFAPEFGMRIATDIGAYVIRTLPRMYALEICVNHWAQMGGNRVHQIAIPLSNAIAFVRACLAKGLDIDEIGPKLHMLGEVNSVDVLAEIAKVRATRRLFARIMRERFGAKKPESWTLKIHMIAPGGESLTRVPLEMNIARGAIATLAGALAGMQSVGGATYDEALGIPSAKASITSIQTRYLVATECGVTETIDPLGGSYYVEYLTSELEDRAVAFMKQIEDMGGAVEAIKAGFVQHEVHRNAYKIQQQIDAGEKTKVGVNLFPEEEGAAERRDYYKPNPGVLASQTAKLTKLRAARDNEVVAQCLSRLRDAAAQPSTPENNLMDPVLAAVRAYATVGEIRRALQDVYGEYRLSRTI
jgi:methylmalonyl-CoA mutase N-terminal domain/subunit